MKRAVAAAAAVLLTTGCAAAVSQQSGATPAPPPATQSASAPPYVPERVFDTRIGSFSDFEAMLADLARADVVLVGEQHDDPNTHRLEAAILQGLRRRQAAVTVSLEMFERDVQPALDAYLAGRTSEGEFLKNGRPWPRYATDYRALVEIARERSWPVVAANLPRRYASEIAKGGLGPLAALPASERNLIARDVQCPKDAYFERFAATMADHPGSGAAPTANTTAAQSATIERYYQSQCVKDETMAEAICASLERRRGPGVIVHFTGAFHTDFGAGTASRVRRRLPGRRVAVISLIPLTDLDGLVPAGDDLKRAEYVVYTVK